jgi:chlorophyllide a reductase subunit Z
MDRGEATPARGGEATSARGADASLPWDDDALALLQQVVQREPVLVQISAAKRWRDLIEADARRQQLPRVTEALVARGTASTRQAVEA